MIISKRSIISGKVNEMDLPVTFDQVVAWESGGLIQNVMPNLSDTQREFLITGMSEEEQDSFYHKGDDL